MELNECFPIGLGSYGFAEQSLYDQNVSDAQQIAILVETFKKGVNYIPGYATYAQGKVLELLSEAIKIAYSDRNDYFLTFCAYPAQYTELAQVEEVFENFLKSLGTPQADCFMLSSQMEGRFGREDSTELLEKVLAKGSAKTIGLTNANLEQLEYYRKVFGEKLVLHEICHNFEVRVFEDLGIIQKHQEYNIKTVIYQPLRRNRTALRNWPILIKLSEKYGVTQNQILIAWLVNKGFLPLIRTVNLTHLDENLAAKDVKLSTEDIAEIDAFSCNIELPKLNWLNFNAPPEEGLYVAKLPNVIDELLA